MNILIFGGSKFVGYYLAENFSQKGNTVFTLTRGTNKTINSKNIKQLYADRTKPDELRAVLQNDLKDGAFDCLVDVSAYTENDVSVTLDVIRKHKIREYIFISSSAVYKNSNAMAMSEDAETGSNMYWGEYGINKLNAEKRFLDEYKKNGFPIVIIRPPYIYGEYNNIYREAFIFDRVLMKKPIVVPNQGNTKVQFIHIQDMFETVEKLLMNDSPDTDGEVFNIGNNNSISFYEWIKLCIEASGKKQKVLAFDYKKYEYKSRDFFPFHDYEYWLNTDKIQKICSPKIAMVDGLARSFQWYCKNESLVDKRLFYHDNSDKIINKAL